MAETLPHAFHIGMSQFNDEEEDAYKDKEEAPAEKEEGGNPKN